ncbi:MAG TPA: hypothetical protein VH817_14485 [Thermoleophilaceae bacterium]|jgi:hypothetical protein
MRRALLDKQLAGGVDAVRDPALALRARQLCSKGTRRSIASALAGLVEMAEEDALPYESPRLDRHAITEQAPLLLMLAQRLRADAAVDPRGVALARRLVSDHGGPIYRPEVDLPRLGVEPRSLAEEAGTALEALEPMPSHNCDAESSGWHGAAPPGPPNLIRKLQFTYYLEK